MDVKGRQRRQGLVLRACAVIAAALFAAHHAAAQAAKLEVPPEASAGLELLYGGDPDAAIAEFRKLQQRAPEDPRGYLLEVNALWWKTYCHTCEIRFNMVDAWDRKPWPEDAQYFALCDKAIALAEKRLKARETAEDHFYAGMGWGLRARLHGLRMDKMPTARTGKKGREHLLRAVQLDSSLADAYAGLGLYNYFVDALSFWVKMLRFFIGIPGGDKALGKQQLERAIRDGVYTSVEARIYLAKNLRNYELDYFASIDWLKPLAERYPENPLIHLLLGDLYSKLNWKEQATQHFRAAQKLTIRDPRCAARVAEIARQALQKLPGATSNGN